MIASDKIQRNMTFLRNLFSKGSFEGHGFACSPPAIENATHPDYDFTISDKDVKTWIPAIVKNYEDKIKMVEAIDDNTVPCAKIFGSTHIYAAAFGCKLHTYPDNNPCALPMVNTAAEADKIEVPDIWKTPVLYRIFELTRAVLDELGDETPIGLPDMQTGFSAAAIIWNKADFLIAMLEEKDAVRRLAAKCAQLFKTFAVEYRKEFTTASSCHCPDLWAPPEMGLWMSNDECGLIDTEMFEDFCLPELIDLSKTFGGLGMHCCADAEHQFNSFKKIPGFYGFNRVEAKQGYSPLLKYFAGDSAPVHVFFELPDETLEYLVKNAPEGTRFVFKLENTTIESAKVWLEKMHKLSPRQT